MGSLGFFDATTVLRELELRFEAAAWKGQSELLVSCATKYIHTTFKLYLPNI